MKPRAIAERLIGVDSSILSLAVFAASGETLWIERSERLPRPDRLTDAEVGRIGVQMAMFSGMVSKAEKSLGVMDWTVIALGMQKLLFVPLTKRRMMLGLRLTRSADGERAYRKAMKALGQPA